MPTQLPTSIHVASKAAFAHVTDVILDNNNITAAFKANGIEDISSILRLTDVTVENLAYHDPDPNVTTTYCLKKGEIGLIKSFIHFVHYRKEIKNPINNQWLKITQDEFDRFRSNLKYTRRIGTLANLKSTAVTSVTSSIPSVTSSSSIPSYTVPVHVNMFKQDIKGNPSACPSLKDELLNDQWHHTFANQARAQDVGDDLNTSDVSKFTLTQAKDAFTYVLENVIENKNVTRALKHEGIDNIISFVKLTDDIVDNLAYHDPNPNIQKLQKLKIGEIGLIKSFIHYVHFREKTNPIGNDWKSITMDDFDQFRANLTYTRRFSSLSSLPPLDMMYVHDSPNIHDVPDVHNVPDVHDITNILDVANVQSVINVSDVSYDLSSTSDISKVTTTGEVLIVHHYINTEYDTNDPVLISSSSSPFPSTPLSKPPTLIGIAR